MKLVILALIAWMVLYLFRKRAISPTETSSHALINRNPHDPVSTHLEWLRAEWKKELATSPPLRHWFSDPVTQPQLRLMKELGIPTRGLRLTKGMASDLIGLYQPIDDGARDILRFFKVPLKGLNQTTGRHQVAQLLSDPALSEQWASRPATPYQREFIRFAGERVPAGLTLKDGNAIISRLEQALSPRKAAIWSLVEDLWRQVEDEGFREDYGRRRPGIRAVRAAVEALAATGQDLDCLSLDDVLDSIDGAAPDEA